MVNLSKVKQNKGITGIDMAISICVIVIFVGLISGLFYNIYSHSTAVRINALAVDYAIKIAEETDRMQYEEVNNDINYELRNKFQIPDAYNTEVSVENYNKKEDVIKIVTIKVNYEFMNHDEEYVIKKLKVKEYKYE